MPLSAGLQGGCFVGLDLTRSWVEGAVSGSSRWGADFEGIDCRETGSGKGASSCSGLSWIYSIRWARDGRPLLGPARIVRFRGAGGEGESPKGAAGGRGSGDIDQRARFTSTVRLGRVLVGGPFHSPCSSERVAMSRLKVRDVPSWFRQWLESGVCWLPVVLSGEALERAGEGGRLPGAGGLRVCGGALVTSPRAALKAARAFSGLLGSAGLYRSLRFGEGLFGHCG